MSMRPEWCPADVWTMAYEFTVPAAETATRNLDYDNVTDEVHAIRSAVSRAILAERERAVKWVADHQTRSNGDPLDPSMPDILYAICTGAAHG